MNWNPHWLAFCRCCGRDPNDRTELWQFIVWVSQREREFRKVRSMKRFDPLPFPDFTEFLESQVDQNRTQGVLFK